MTTPGVTMNTRWTRILIHFLLWAAISLAGFGAAVWQLWNHLMPELFGLAAIGYWQACGLMGLCWVLFGGWRWSSLPRAGRARPGASPMTDQERHELREKLGNRAASGPA
jgi:hypothetical protein